LTSIRNAVYSVLSYSKQSRPYAAPACPNVTCVVESSVVPQGTGYTERTFKPQLVVITFKKCALVGARDH
jgi:hypothetical protein